MLDPRAGYAHISYPPPGGDARVRKFPRKRALAVTNEWGWNDDGDGTPGGCIRQRISNERTILLKNRTSQEGGINTEVFDARSKGVSAVSPAGHSRRC